MTSSRFIQSEQVRSRPTRPTLALVIALLLAIAPRPGGAPARGGDRSRQRH